MAEATAGTAGTGVTGGTELARNALGLPQILFCIVTGSAPLAAMMFNNPLALIGFGHAVPAGFWIATLCFTAFSVGYIEMARRVTTAGGMYSYMSYGFGRIVGLGTAVGIAAAYLLFAVGVNGVTAYFAQTGIQDLSGGFDLDWRWYAFIFIGLMFVLSYFHVEVIAKILGFCLIGEVIVLMIFSFAVLVQGGANGISFEPLNPAAMFNSGSGTAASNAVFGFSAAGVGFFACFWSWVGFEMAPNYAEESRNPKKLMATAIYVSCIGLGILYTFWSWMLINAYGIENNAAVWAAGIERGLATFDDAAAAGAVLPHTDTSYASVFYPVAREFLGVGLKNLFEVLIITGSFACAFAFWNTANRYLFAMGRESIIPRVFGRTHAKHRSPFVAATFTLVFTLIVTLLFAAGWVGGGQRAALEIGTDSPLVPLFQIGTWLPFQGNMILFPIMAVVNLAILVYFWRDARDGFHWFKTGLMPVIGAAAISFGVYLMLKNRAFITGTGEYEGWVKAVPYYSLGIFLGGCAIAIGYRVFAKSRYEAVGKFIHEEA